MFARLTAYLPEGAAAECVLRAPQPGLIGRAPPADLLLAHPSVSRRHAEFRRDAHGVKVRDVGSLNGTYVNRDRIDEVQLTNGDEVQIGKYRLVFFSSHPES